MRLLDTHTGHFIEADPTRIRLLDTESGYDFEKIEYAILSHTWDQRKGEQTYKQLRKIQKRNEPQQGSSTTTISSTASPGYQGQSPRPIWDDPEVSPKIREACAVARANGFRYLWIDSCCIDKSSSSELSEAINSMYLWYAGAVVCYAYLADVSAEEDPHAEGSWFRDSRWFTRGWTLQELIAPSNLVFLSQEWAILGSKHTLVSLVEDVTGIDGRALLHLESLDKFSVSQRLSWASRRETTRVEDQAYSLLGLFDIHMPIVYGEGKRAFRHLQEQIMQRIPDQSLFAWGSIDSEFLTREERPKSTTTVMAHTSMSTWWKTIPDSDIQGTKSPSLFASDVSMFGTQSRSIRAVTTSNVHLQEYRTTPHGIRTQFPMIPLSQWFPSNSVHNYSGWYLAILACEHQDHPGHPLGRICFISSDSTTQRSPTGKVELLYPGLIDGKGKVAVREMPGSQDATALLLSPRSIERCGRHMEVKTVYISHPNHNDPGPASLVASAGSSPLEEFKILLLKATCDGLKKQGYTAALSSSPSQGLHRLTLSKAEHTVAVEFQHEVQGGAFTRLIIDCQADLRTGFSKDIQHSRTRTMKWTWHVLTFSPYFNQHTVEMDTGQEQFTMKFNMQFAGMGFYALYIEFLSKP